MKEKLPSDKPHRDINSKNSSSKAAHNLFLNFIIFVLGIVVVFLAYSLVIKITENTTNEKAESTGKTKSAVIQLEVLNGCGASGVAEKFTDYLRQRNFDVVQVGNYMSFDIDKSMVIDRTGNKANAFKVADTLGIDGSNVIQQINNNYFLDVSLIIGKDYNQLKPTK